MRKFLLQLFIVICASAGAFYFFYRYVPINMDEVSFYHVLACHQYPLNMLNDFRESCSQYDIKPPLVGRYLPLMENRHQGAISSFLYWPLFRLWPSPYSSRLWALILFAVQTFFLARICRTSWALTHVLMLLFMPYAFLHLVDIGPISALTASTFAVLWLVQQWVKKISMKESRGWICAGAAGFLIACCIWIKLSYFAILPGVMFLIANTIIENRQFFLDASKRAMLQRQGFLFLIMAVVPLFFLFGSINRYGDTLFAFVYRSGAALTTDHKPKWYLIKDLAHPLSSTHKIFMTGGHFTFWADHFYLYFLLVLLILGGIGLYKKGVAFNFFRLNVLLYIMTVLLVIIYPGSQDPAHLALASPF